MEIKQKQLTIGEPVPRVDAYTKVTGKERYAADYYGEKFLWAVLKGQAYPMLY